MKVRNSLLVIGILVFFVFMTKSEVRGETEVIYRHAMPYLGSGWYFVHTIGRHDLPKAYCFSRKDNIDHYGWAVQWGAGTKGEDYFELLNIHFAWWFEPGKFCSGIYESGFTKFCKSSCHDVIEGLPEKGIDSVHDFFEEKLNGFALSFWDKNLTTNLEALGLSASACALGQMILQDAAAGFENSIMLLSPAELQCLIFYGGPCSNGSPG
jgi:hypothetical protein